MTFKVLVDWANDGRFDGTHDDISADVMRASWRLGARRPYQLVADESSLRLELVNTDGKYTPENAGSPLAGNIKPFRQVRVVWDAGAEHIPLWAGYIDLPEVRWEVGRRANFAVIEGFGAKRLLEDEQIAIGYQTDVRSSDIIRQALIQSGIVSLGERVWLAGVAGFSEAGVSTFAGEAAVFGEIDEGKLIFDAYGDGGTRSALDVLTSVTQSERGKFWFGRAGGAVWWNRHRALTTLDDDGTVTFGADPTPVAMEYTFGANIANIVRATVTPARSDAGEALWSLDEPVTVGIGREATFEVRLRRASGQFAGGVNLTATPTFASGAATVTAEARGGIAVIRIDNAAGSVQAVLAALVVTGEPVVRQNAFTVVARDEESIGQYGRRVLNVNLGEVGRQSDAAGVAQFELARRAEARGLVQSITWRTAFDGIANAHLIDDWKMGSRLRVVLPDAHHDDSYFVVGEMHEWRAGENGVHEATYYLEPVVKGNFWLAGAAGFSEAGETTFAGY